MAAIFLLLLLTATIRIEALVKGPGHKSEQYCFDAYSQTFSLDNPNTLVEEFPFMAAIGYLEENDKIIWRCSGILINENYVLTTAHCLKPTTGSPKVVRFGQKNLAATLDDFTTQTVNISKSIPHPDYRSRTRFPDIGLIRLESAIKFTKFVKSACLETEGKALYEYLFSASWGMVDYFETPRMFLKKINFIQYSNADCRKFYNATGKVAFGVDDNLFVCAGTGNPDKCVETGSPLLTVDQTYGYRVIGIASFSKPCVVQNIPTVYHKIYYYIPWIESIVWNG